MSDRLVDLSHSVEHGMVTYKGLPAPTICDFLSREASRAFYSEGTEFQIGSIELVGNTGTYLDSPFHRFADGRDLSELALAQVADLDGVVVRASGPAIDAEAFDGVDVSGRAVLVHTGWDVHWRTERYFEGHPFLTEAAARTLVERGAALVGVDAYNVDDTSTRSRPVHTVLLGAGVLVVEHMTNLAALPDSGFRFFAVPVKVKRFGTFPVRAFARLWEVGESNRGR